MSCKLVEVVMVGGTDKEKKTTDNRQQKEKHGTGIKLKDTRHVDVDDA